MEARVEERALARMWGPWWLFLITGIAWLMVSIIVLRADVGSVAAIAVLAGFVFTFAGVNEFLTASMVEGWRWLHVVFGVLFIVPGVLAFLRPAVRHPP